MKKFYLEEPSLERINDVKEYIEEHLKYNSSLHGTSGLDKEYLNYENWLHKMELLSNLETCPNNLCPGREYFLIRESDNKLIGMINLRWNLNEWMLTNGGHIGYGIRPTERRKGYNKISLYLCLLKAKEIGLDKVLLTASDNNLGSVKTIQALGGVLENKITDYEDKNILMGRYWINVDESIEKYKEEYEKYIQERKDNYDYRKYKRRNNKIK